MPETANTLWYADHRNLHLVAEFLVKDGADTDEVLEMLDKPWHFDKEFARAYRDLLQRTGLTDSHTV